MNNSLRRKSRHLSDGSPPRNKFHRTSLNLHKDLRTKIADKNTFENFPKYSRFSASVNGHSSLDIAEYSPEEVDVIQDEQEDILYEERENHSSMFVNRKFHFYEDCVHQRTNKRDSSAYQMNLKEDTFAKEEESLTALDIKHEQTKEEIHQTSVKNKMMYKRIKDLVKQVNELKTKNENIAIQHDIKLRKQKELYEHNLKEVKEEYKNEIERLISSHSDTIEKYKKQLEAKQTNTEVLEKKLKCTDEWNKKLHEIDKQRIEECEQNLRMREVEIENIRGEKESIANEKEIETDEKDFYIFERNNYKILYEEHIKKEATYCNLILNIINKYTKALSKTVTQCEDLTKLATRTQLKLDEKEAAFRELCENLEKDLERERDINRIGEITYKNIKDRYDKRLIDKDNQLATIRDEVTVKNENIKTLEDEYKNLRESLHQSQSKFSQLKDEMLQNQTFVEKSYQVVKKFEDIRNMMSE